MYSLYIAVAVALSHVDLKHYILIKLCRLPEKMGYFSFQAASLWFQAA